MRSTSEVFFFIFSLFLTAAQSFFMKTIYLSGRSSSHNDLYNRKMLIMSNILPYLQIEKDEKSVGRALCNILVSEAKKSIASKGSFSFGISGGSMLKMLKNLDASDIEWSKSHMIFVSHRCVSLDDDGATYHKARPLFLQSWMDLGLNVVTVSGGADAEAEAIQYEKALKLLPFGVLPFNTKGYPIFDLLLIGVGTDGHVGSIYPNIKADVESERVVVPATSKNGKISLSLNAMLASKMNVVACAGKSSKAPLGKAEAMVRSLEADETELSFPASALRYSAKWLIDENSSILLNRKNLNVQE